MTSGSSSEQAPKTTRSRTRRTATIVADAPEEAKPATKRTRATKTTKSGSKAGATKTEPKKKAVKAEPKAKAAKIDTKEKTVSGTRSARAKATGVKATAKTSRATTATAKAATKTTRSRSKPEPAAEADGPTIAQVTSGEIEVEVQRDGNDVVLKVGGKKRSLDEVDDSQFIEEKEATLEKELVEEEGFSLSDKDDADEPEQQVVSAGATADPVKDYLKQIGKVALLNAVEEVELAKRIEPAFSLRSGSRTPITRSFPTISRISSGSPMTAATPRTTSWRPTCVSSSLSRSATRDAGCCSST